MNLSDEQNFKLLQTCSGHFTTSNIPDNWNTLSDEEQNIWLEDHKWEPFEYWEPSQVWNIINAAHHSANTFIKENL